MDGFRLEEIAPTIYARIPRRIRRQLMVREAVQNGTWAAPIGPDIDALTLTDFINLWTRVQHVQLQEGV